MREALHKAHREDLIGFGPKCLVRPGNGKSSGSGGGEARESRRQGGRKGAHGAGIIGNGARGGNGGKGATSDRGSKVGATKRGGKGGLSNARGERVGTHRPDAGNGSKAPSPLAGHRGQTTRFVSEKRRSRTSKAFEACFSEKPGKQASFPLWIDCLDRSAPYRFSDPNLT